MTFNVPAIGSTSLGIVIGWLVRYFLFRFKKFDRNVLSSVVTILLGGVVLKFLSTDKSVIWFYPIGLLIGFVVYTVTAVIAIRKSPVQGADKAANTSPRAHSSGGGGSGSRFLGALYGPNKRNW